MHNVSNLDKDTSKNTVAEYSSLQKIGGSKSSCTAGDIRKADDIRQKQDIFAFPINITVDIDQVNGIYGPSENMLKGETHDRNKTVISAYFVFQFHRRYSLSIYILNFSHISCTSTDILSSSRNLGTLTFD